MASPVTLDIFGGMLDRTGLILTAAQKAALFEVYPLFQTMIARATPAMPREAEPAVMFTSEVK